MEIMINPEKWPLRPIRHNVDCYDYGWGNEFRYGLEVVVDPDNDDSILILGVNPGGKTNRKDRRLGRTVTHVLNLLKDGEHIYGHVFFVNLTPVIDLNPKNLENKGMSIARTHEINIGVIQNIIRDNNIANVLLCYGNSYKNADSCGLFSAVLSAIDAATDEEIQYLCFGKTGNDYPCHPRLVKNGTGIMRCQPDFRQGTIKI